MRGQQHMQLINNDTRQAGDADVQMQRFDSSLEELIRRAKLQTSELSLMVQRLEQLRRDIQQHLHCGPSA